MAGKREHGDSQLLAPCAFRQDGDVALPAFELDWVVVGFDGEAPEVPELVEQQCRDLARGGVVPRMVRGGMGMTVMGQAAGRRRQDLRGIPAERLDPAGDPLEVALEDRVPPRAD